MVYNDATPIFIQIKEQIKDDIMSGVYEVDELIISTTQISKLYSVNPATAVKSVGLLQDEGIVYKKRGIGMCVAAGAPEKIKEERKEQFLGDTLRSFIGEAKKLKISKELLVKIITEVSDYD